MVLEIDMALVKRCNLDKLDITISPTLRTQWKIWMPCCLYSNSSWDSSICCIRRQGLGLATSSISIYEDRKLAKSARERRTWFLELTPARFPNQWDYDFAGSGGILVKKGPEEELTSYWKAAQQNPPRRYSEGLRQGNQACWRSQAKFCDPVLI